MFDRSVIVVVHDTQELGYKWPRHWAGMRSYTETTNNVGTTVIQGRLDEVMIRNQTILNAK